MGQPVVHPRDVGRDVEVPDMRDLDTTKLNLDHETGTSRSNRMSGSMYGRPVPTPTMARTKTKLCPLADKAPGQLDCVFDIRRAHSFATT